MDSDAFSEDSDSSGDEIRQLRAAMGLVYSDGKYVQDEVSCPKLIYLEKIGLKGQLYNLLLIK